MAPLATPVEKPDPHSRHASCCALGAYVPGSHASQEVPSSTYVPAEQSPQDVRSAELSLPSAQSVQLDCWTEASVKWWWLATQ